MIKPEKKVESEIRAWCFQNNIWVDVYDSKAVYSLAKKSYTKSSAMKTGTPDLLGMNKQGMIVAIELKSELKQNIARIEQLQFLTRVIDYNGFACVASSVQKLKNLYHNWLDLSLTDRQDYLKSNLPKKALIAVIVNNKKVFRTIDYAP